MTETEHEIKVATIADSLTNRQIVILKRLYGGDQLTRTAIPGLLRWTDDVAVENESDFDRLVFLGLIDKGDL